MADSAEIRNAYSSATDCTILLKFGGLVHYGSTETRYVVGHVIKAKSDWWDGWHSGSASLIASFSSFYIWWFTQTIL